MSCLRLANFNVYSPTLGSATDIQNLEKNGSLAFCKNTFMTLNLRKKFFVLKGETFYKEMLRDTEENWPYYSAALVKIQRLTSSESVPGA